MDQPCVVDTHRVSGGSKGGGAGVAYAGALRLPEMIEIALGIRRIGPQYPVQRLACRAVSASAELLVTCCVIVRRYVVEIRV